MVTKIFRIGDAIVSGKGTLNFNKNGVGESASGTVKVTVRCFIEKWFLFLKLTT